MKQQLFLCKCLHAYGAESWNLGSSGAAIFWKASGQAARRVVGLPPSCHTTIVDTLYGTRVAKTATYKKFLGLIKACKESDNEKVNFVFQNAMADARSLIRQNLDVNNREWGGYAPPQFLPDSSPECLAIQELLGVREGNHHSDFDMDDVDEFVMLLCMR